MEIYYEHKILLVKEEADKSTSQPVVRPGGRQGRQAEHAPGARVPAVSEQGREGGGGRVGAHPRRALG
eukprot:1901890-Prymnesium_polylepis.1